MAEPIRMANGSYPISSQHSANSAWKLRGHSDTYSEAQVVAHIRLACRKLGLHFPGTEQEDRETAYDRMLQARAHGFVYPPGLPPCAQCGQDANVGPHVNPPRVGVMGLSYTPERRRVMSREGAADRMPFRGPQRSHVYAAGSVSRPSALLCSACGQSLHASPHAAGMPVMTGLAQRADVNHDLVTTSPGSGSGPEEGFGQIVLVRHPFQALPGLQSVDADYKLCALCGFAEDDEVHQYSGDSDGDDSDKNLVTVKRFAGPTGTGTVGSSVGGGTMDAAAYNGSRQQAFVAEIGDKTVLAAPASVFTDPAGLPRELAVAWERAAAANPHFMWVEGRYVEADAPNRNMAYWSSQDLELGQPTVAHGPLNWLHDERHIVGTVAAASLIRPGREAAAAGERSHIRALSALWRYLYPGEARQVAAASDKGTLWFSMECYSRQVACMHEGCSHSQPYSEYMAAPYKRCHHIKAGGVRRFAEPEFTGGAIIIPPVRPGWAGAHASVVRQAAALAEKNESAFAGLAESDAVSVVAQVIRYATGGAL